MRANRISWLSIFSAASFLGAVALLAAQLVLYSRSFAAMPAGLSLGGVPVGGLSEQAAIEQLLTVYRSPLELRYQDSLILLDPSLVGFDVDTGLMLPEVNQIRNNESFWSGFWKFLWLQPTNRHDIPLKARYSADRLSAFLQEVAARYDHPGNPPQADVNTLGFVAGAPGQTLRQDEAASLINTALYSPSARSVKLPISEQTVVNPSLDTLAELIRADINQRQFSGIFSLYLADLKTGRELLVDLRAGQPLTGPVAYSAMSTIKIPIMVSFFSRNQRDLSDDERLLLGRSIDESQNTATDLLLKTIGRGDDLEGTRRATADMLRLGLPNTYISGLLDTAGKVLAPLATPANSRPDVNTLPDPYNQSTAEDMGALLVMIHQCSQGRGAFMAAFPGQFTPAECQMMIDLLSRNALGPAFVSGGSPGAVVAHKHGWDSVPLTNVGDAALVFTPTSSYVLVIYLNQPETMGFEDANRLIISVSRAVFNFFNPPAP